MLASYRAMNHSLLSLVKTKLTVTINNKKTYITVLGFVSHNIQKNPAMPFVYFHLVAGQHFITLQKVSPSVADL